MDIFIDELNSHSRALLIFFTKSKAQARRINVSLQDKNSFCKVNDNEMFPDFQVPAMKDKKLGITDPIEIMKYVSEKYLSPLCPLYPRMNILETYEIDLILRKYEFLITKRIPEVYKKLKNPFSQISSSGIVNFNLEEIMNVKLFLHEVDKFIIQNESDQYFIIDGRCLTIADILILCDIVQLSLLDIDFFSYSKIYNWLKICFQDKVIVKAHTKFFIWVGKLGKVKKFTIM